MKKKKSVFEFYKDSWKFLKECKEEIIIAFAIFCMFVIIGFALPIWFRTEIFDLIKQLSNQFEGLGLFTTIAYIFLNNLKASFLAIIAGILFGIFPVITAIINGYLVGFVSRIAVEKQGIFVLWRLVPHGIFEIPSVILSIGFGLKLGMNFFKKKKDRTLTKDFIESMKFFGFIIFPLLLIAAIIEGVLVFYFG